jgi:hypothetical protein
MDAPFIELRYLYLFRASAAHHKEVRYIYLANGTYKMTVTVILEVPFATYIHLTS